MPTRNKPTAGRKKWKANPPVSNTQSGKRKQNPLVCWDCVIDWITRRNNTGEQEDDVIEEVCNLHVSNNLPGEYYHRTQNCKTPKADKAFKVRVKNRLNKARLRECCGKDTDPPSSPESDSGTSSHGQEGHSGPMTPQDIHETSRAYLLQRFGEEFMTSMDLLTSRVSETLATVIQDTDASQHLATYLVNKKPAAGLG
eukprot:m.244512 g.244512  ORF g.244512 m.244512 type:complete len:198 (-) comp16105_c0_seq10:2979-3572(-)